MAKTFLTDKILLDELIEYDALAEDEQPISTKHSERKRRNVESESAATTLNAAAAAAQQPPKCKPGGPRHNRCCNDGFEHSTDMKELKRQCFAEVKKARKAKHHGGGMDGGDFDAFSCEKMERAKEKVLCAMECVSRKQNLVMFDLNMYEFFESVMHFFFLRRVLSVCLFFKVFWRYSGKT